MSGRQSPRLERSAIEACAASAVEAMALANLSVRTHLEFVLDDRVGALTPDQRRFLDLGWRHSRRLTKLAEDFRDVVHASTGKLTLNRGPCDIALLVEQAVELVWPVAFAEKKAIEVKVVGKTGLDADRKLLGRALSEVFDYAVQMALNQSVIDIQVEGARIEIAYEAEEPPAEDELGLVLADVIAGLHGGALTTKAADTHMTMALLFAGEPAQLAQAV
jgi:signal transduction histidine kinase